MAVDYFGEYFNDTGFHFDRLLDDDFFQPVRILFQAKHYVSATKLLMVAIDSVGYVEHGESRENTFIKWLDEYADLNQLGITSEELWEHRNALLHMSNLDSRKVKAGKVRRLVAYVGILHPNVPLEEKDAGYFSLQDLIRAFAKACSKWVTTYGENREKIHDFVERYDLIASDARMLTINYD